MTFAGALALAAATATAQHAGHGGHPGPAGHAAPPAGSPYAGWQGRDIKALSPEDIERLLQGHGMSLALAAELNGYPGPSHTLELAQPLGLTAAQQRQTQALMDQHKARARELGARILEAERALDRSFASGRASEALIEQHTREIGELQAQLRAEHLQTHLKQRALLQPQQVAQYQRLRGYAAAASPEPTHPHGGHR